MGYAAAMSDFADETVAFRLREQIARKRISRARLARRQRG
jgi:hypothetical protein